MNVSERGREAPSVQVAAFGWLSSRSRWGGCILDAQLTFITILRGLRTWQHG